MTTQFVDRHQVGRRFSRVAANYGEADFFAREVDRRMQERLDFVAMAPRAVLDIGCSRGGSFSGLAQRYPEAAIVGVDLVPAMLQETRAPLPAWQRWLARGRTVGPQRIAADAVQLPLKSASFALVWSNLLLHWLDDPIPALAEAYRVLEVGGLLMFSTLGPDTLRELRTSLSDGYVHTQRFIDMHDLGDMMIGCGFADPVVDMELITLTYEDIDTMFRELRAAGSSCAMTARRRGLMPRKTLDEARAAYERYRQAGKLPATFEVVYGHAWKAAPRQAPDGRAIIRFETARKK